MEIAPQARGTRDSGWETQNRGVWEVFGRGQKTRRRQSSAAEIDQGGWALALRDDGSRYRPAGAGPGTVAGTVQGPLAGSRAGGYGAASRRACTGTLNCAGRGCHATGALRRVSRQGRDMPFSSPSCTVQCCITAMLRLMEHMPVLWAAERDWAKKAMIEQTAIGAAAGIQTVMAHQLTCNAHTNSCASGALLLSFVLLPPSILFSRCHTAGGDALEWRVTNMNVAAHWPKRGTTSAGDAIQSANMRQRAANQVPPAPSRGSGGKKEPDPGLLVQYEAQAASERDREREREREPPSFFLWLQGSSNPCPSQAQGFLTRDPLV